MVVVVVVVVVVVAVVLLFLRLRISDPNIPLGPTKVSFFKFATQHYIVRQINQCKQ